MQHSSYMMFFPIQTDPSVELNFRSHFFTTYKMFIPSLRRRMANLTSLLQVVIVQHNALLGR